MNNMPLVKICNGVQQTCNNPTRPSLARAISVIRNNIEQIFPPTLLHDDVNVFLIFNHIYHFYHIRVIYTLEEGDFVCYQVRIARSQGDRFDGESCFALAVETKSNCTEGTGPYDDGQYLVGLADNTVTNFYTQTQIGSSWTRRLRRRRQLGLVSLRAFGVVKHQLLLAIGIHCRELGVDLDMK